MSIEAIRILPNRKPELITVENEDDAIRAIIRGEYDCVELSENPSLCVVFDSEHEFESGAGYNGTIDDVDYYGPLLIVAADDTGHFISLSDEQAEWAMERFERDGNAEF